MVAISNGEEMQSASDEEETQSTSDEEEPQSTSDEEESQSKSDEEEMPQSKSDEEEMPQSKSDEEDSSRLTPGAQDNLGQGFLLFRDLHLTNRLFERCPEDDHRAALIFTDDVTLWKPETSRPFACVFTYPPIRNVLRQSGATCNGLGPEGDHQSVQEELEKFCQRLRTEVCDEVLSNIHWGFHETDNGTVHYILSTTEFNVEDFLRSNYVPINA